VPPSLRSAIAPECCWNRLIVDVDLPVTVLPAWLTELLQPKPLPAAPVAPIALHGRDRRSRYLNAAVAAEVARVEGAGPGGGGALTESDVRDTLMRAAAGHIAVNAYTANTAEGTIRSGLRAGAKRPRRVAA
jgi:hypothetical protein